MPPPSLTAAYAVLGLAPGASPEEIRRAWRRAARETHPDLHPDDPAASARFLAAKDAYELLSDPTRARAAGRAAAAPRGPDEDWVDACVAMAEAHLHHLRVDILPRYAMKYGGGPSLAAALQQDAAAGLSGLAPPEPASRWARTWSEFAWRRVVLMPDTRRAWGGGAVGLLERDGKVWIHFWPLALWDEALEDTDTLRPVVQRMVDRAVAAAAPMVLDTGFDHSPGADRRWWMRKLAMPAAWVIAAILSVVLLLGSWRDSHDESVNVRQLEQLMVPSVNKRVAP